MPTIIGREYWEREFWQQVFCAATSAGAGDAEWCAAMADRAVVQWRKRFDSEGTN